MTKPYMLLDSEGLIWIGPLNTVQSDMIARVVIGRLLSFDSSKLFENGLARVELYAKKIVKLIQIIVQKIKIHACKNCFQVGLREGDEA